MGRLIAQLHESPRLKQGSADGETCHEYGDAWLEVRPDYEADLLHGEVSAVVIELQEDDESYNVESACASEASVLSEDRRDLDGCTHTNASMRTADIHPFCRLGSSRSQTALSGRKSRAKSVTIFGT